MFLELYSTNFKMCLWFIIKRLPVSWIIELQDLQKELEDRVILLSIRLKIQQKSPAE
jgi:hypothetical protein